MKVWIINIGSQPDLTLVFDSKAEAVDYCNDKFTYIEPGKWWDGDAKDYVEIAAYTLTEVRE